jgi:hypothetical protein
MVSFDLWAGRAVTTTLSPKFGGPAQIWGRIGLGKGRVGWNPRPPFSPPLSSLPQGLGGKGEKGEKRGGEKGGKGGGGDGCMGWSMHHPLPWLPPQSSSKIEIF